MLNTTPRVEAADAAAVLRAVAAYRDGTPLVAEVMLDGLGARALPAAMALLGAALDQLHAHDISHTH